MTGRGTCHGARGFGSPGQRPSTGMVTAEGMGALPVVTPGCPWSTRCGLTSVAASWRAP